MKKIFTKKLLFILALMMSMFSSTNAQVIFTDNFTYSGALTSNGWTAHSGAGTNPVSTTTGLVYPGIQTSNIGNAALIQSVSGEDVNFAFTAVGSDGQSIYMSALVNITETASSKTGDYFLHLGPNPIGTSFVGRVAAKVTADVVNFGLGAAGTITYGTTAFAKNTTYLLIVKYTISTAGNETVSLWVAASGVPASEVAAGTAEVVSTGAAQNTIGSVALRQGATASMPATVVDGILIGLSWADVTPTGVSTPAITAGPAVTALAAVSGNASAPGTFNVSGTNLTGAPSNLTATASSGLEVSLASGGPYSGSVSIPYASATLANTPVYVRIAATAPTGAVSGSVTLLGGGDTDGASVSVSGIVTVGEPTVQASNVSVSAINNFGFTVNWTNGNGASRLVVIRTTATTQVVPADGTGYTIPSSTSTTAVSNGNNIYYTGNGSGPLTVTGLVPGTNYTVQVYEFNGTGSAANYLTIDGTNNPVATTTTGSTPVLLQSNFTSVSAPQFAASGNTTRLPVMYFATVSGLKANTTYRYYTLAEIGSNINTASNGAGVPISIDYTQPTPTFAYSATGSLSAAGQYGKFTTDASGSFTGSFGYVNSGNATRFVANAVVYPTITLGEEATYTNTQHIFALNDGIKILKFGNTVTDSTGSFIQGQSTALPGNLVGLWSTVDGNIVAQRPLAMTISEGMTVNGTGTTWGSNFIAGYDQNESSWNTIIPNQNANGVRLIQQFNLRTGAVVGCNSDADGTWPSGAVTVNPINNTTPVVITEPDATLTGGACFGIVLPVRLANFAVQKQGNSTKITWTTEQEINTRNFIVETSTDQRNWTVVATVAAAGNSLSRISYSTAHFTPAKGINFYRLRTVDMDNRFENSATRSVLFGNADVVLITPNPAVAFANIYMGKTDNSLSEIIVTDMNGKQVERVRTADQTHKLETAKYSKGVYVVKVITGANISTQKLVVQ